MLLFPRHKVHGGSAYPQRKFSYVNKPDRPGNRQFDLTKPHRDAQQDIANRELRDSPQGLSGRCFVHQRLWYDRPVPYEGDALVQLPGDHGELNHWMQDLHRAGCAPDWVTCAISGHNKYAYSACPYATCGRFPRRIVNDIWEHLRTTHWGQYPRCCYFEFATAPNDIHRCIRWFPSTTYGRLAWLAHMSVDHDVLVLSPTTSSDGTTYPKRRICPNTSTRSAG